MFRPRPPRWPMAKPLRLSTKRSKGRTGGFNRSVQHGRVFSVVRTGGMGLANLGRPGLSALRKKDLWDRWKAGESISDIAGRSRSLPALFMGYSKPLVGS